MNTFKHLTSICIVAMAFISSSVFAGTVGAMTTFTAGSPAVAAEVNGNFTEHTTQINDNWASLPTMWSNPDVGSNGTGLIGAVLSEVNTISMTAPSNGFLVISGDSFVNPTTTGIFYALMPYIDGSVNIASQSARYSSNTDGFSLAYIYTVPITAGAHTISQRVGPQTGTADFYYNRNSLTVVFYPSNKGVISSPALGATNLGVSGSDIGLDENGE